MIHWLETYEAKYLSNYKVIASLAEQVTTKQLLGEVDLNKL
jgi:hypothetical protein